MSLKVMSWVLEESEAQLGARLVLLALADFAHDDGTKAWPSVATLGRKARLSERGTQYALRKLEDEGMIVQTGSSKAGTKVYTVVCPFNPQTADIAPGGVQNGTAGVSRIAPDPLEDPLEPSSSSSPTGWLPRSVGGKAVTAAEAEHVDSVLDLFNELAGGTKYRGKSWREAIIRRLREHPELGLPEHQELVRHQFEHPWWKNDATPGVIWGNDRVFERTLNRAGSDQRARHNAERDFSAYAVRDELGDFMEGDAESG